MIVAIVQRNQIQNRYLARWAHFQYKKRLKTKIEYKFSLSKSSHLDI